MCAVAMATMPTIRDRENLMLPCAPRYSGFTPRPTERLTTRRKPHTALDIECQHFLRTKSDNTHKTLEYRLWIEAGKHEPPFPDRPDTSYNSNVWRNFRRQYGFDMTAASRKTSEVIAAMYPLNIPVPSQIGENTFGKYISDSRIFLNEKFKMMAIKKTDADLREFKKLKLKTELRNPPLDEAGNILPPENFKKYVPRFLPPPLVSTQTKAEAATYRKQQTDMFGQRYIPRSQPHLYKLTYALNHPEYDTIRKEIVKRREMLENKACERDITTPTTSLNR